MGLLVPGNSTNRAKTVYYDNFSVSPTSGLTTSLFSLKITHASGAPISPAAVPAECVVGAASILVCIAATNGSTAWYAVLSSSSGGVLATYPTTSDSTFWNGGTVNVASSDNLILISGAALAGSGDYLAVFGTGSSTVTGGVTL